MKHHHLFLPCLIAACLGLYPFLISAALHESDNPTSSDIPSHHKLKKTLPPSSPENSSSAMSLSQPTQPLHPSSREEEDLESDFVDMREVDRYLAARDQRRRQYSPQVSPSDIEMLAQQLAAQNVDRGGKTPKTPFPRRRHARAPSSQAHGNPLTPLPPKEK